VPDDTRFNLAIEYGHLVFAMDIANAVDRPQCWKKLGQQVLIKAVIWRVISLDFFGTIFRLWTSLRSVLNSEGEEGG